MILHKLREKIAFKPQHLSQQFRGKIEIDESYFGRSRKEKRIRSAAGKVAVLLFQDEEARYIPRLFSMQNPTLLCLSLGRK